MIPLPKGSLYYFHRVMNWDHIPCADWREVQPQLSPPQDDQTRTEFSDVFSNDLPKEPANIPPFNLILDNLKWRVGKNRAPPRTQSAVKQTELFKTLQTLISQGILEKSQSPQCSQILMVPKPDGTFRLCVDYRALNGRIADAS